MSERWSVEHHRGSAAAFHAHAVPEPPQNALWSFDVDRPAVVLGSTQRDEVVDLAAAAAAGIEVVKRRSGGGAVLVSPGSTIWIDVILPASDPRWEHDVGRSFGWIGQAWTTVLGELGHAGAVAHDGGMVRTPWSDLVCFAGLGPGEVTVSGQKVVGISQRRTRASARFQCALLQRWDPRPLIDVLALSQDERGRAGKELAEVATGVGPVERERVVTLLRDVIASTG